MVAQHPERDLIYAAAGAYLASFDSFLRARTMRQLKAADDGMGRSVELICEFTGIAPARRPRRVRARLAEIA